MPAPISASDIEDFIRSKGVTKCPTRFAVPSQHAAKPLPPIQDQVTPPEPITMVRDEQKPIVQDLKNSQKEHTARFLVAAMEQMVGVATRLGVTNQGHIMHAKMANELNNIPYLRVVYNPKGNTERPWTSDDVRFVRREIVARGLMPQP